jgi:hypothetical protein
MIFRAALRQEVPMLDLTRREYGASAIHCPPQYLAGKEQIFRNSAHDREEWRDLRLKTKPKAIHPASLTTLADLWERAAIGPIPGGLVVAAGVLFHGAWAVLALVTYTSRSPRDASGGV